MPKATLFVNDNYFSYLLAKPFIEHYYNDINCIIFSKNITGNTRKIIEIYRKSYPSYFFYRSLIEFISNVFPYYRKRTVFSLAKNYKIHTVLESNINQLYKKQQNLFTGDIGLAFNFDQIIKDKILCTFPKGVINVHASKLPYDKGISPVLWAFARGDQTIWGTIYQMDVGIDSGPILKQFSMPVFDTDSAFSLYQRVCERGGEELLDVLEQFDQNAIWPIEQDITDNASYWSWPNTTHKGMMKQSGRSFLNFQEVLGMRIL